jgi:hypothetical protein
MPPFDLGALMTVFELIQRPSARGIEKSIENLLTGQVHCEERLGGKVRDDIEHIGRGDLGRGELRCA